MIPPALDKKIIIIAGPNGAGKTSLNGEKTNETTGIVEGDEP